jgi:hypothetical protein
MECGQPVADKPKQMGLSLDELVAKKENTMSFVLMC